MSPTVNAGVAMLLLMMRALFLFPFLLSLSVGDASASEVQMAINEYSKMCPEPSTYPKSWITWGKIKYGTKTFKYIHLDYNGVRCNGEIPFCGNTGNCTQLVFEELPNGHQKKIIDDSAISVDVQAGDNEGIPAPEFVITRHDMDCEYNRNAASPDKIVPCIDYFWWDEENQALIGTEDDK